MLRAEGPATAIVLRHKGGTWFEAGEEPARHAQLQGCLSGHSNPLSLEKYRIRSHVLRRILIASAAVIILAVGGSRTAQAQTVADMNSTLDTLFGNHEPYREFLETLKKAVGENDRRGVSAMVAYPFRARIGGKAVKINDAAHFIAEYDAIITARVKQAVMGQAYAALFANWHGVSIGNGEIWFSGTGRPVKITAIND
jgi:hypothetical protein